MLANTSSNCGGGVSPAIKQVSAVKLRHSRSDYLVVDIREPSEIETDPLPDEVEADATMTMGNLFHIAETGTGSAIDEWKASNKVIVLVCNSGHRATLAGSEILSRGGFASDKVAVLTRGLIGLRNPAATVPDLLVVLCTKSKPQKLTLAITACSAAATAGETVALVLMGDGVCTFLRKGNNKEEMSPTSFRVEETFVGEPFKPCNIALREFVGSGNGLVLGCTTCVKSRGLEFGSDLLDCVQPIPMPDLLRMLGEAKKNLQFM